MDGDTHQADGPVESEITDCEQLLSEMFVIKKKSAQYTLFDKVIGHIEDILMEEEFQALQQHYLTKYWKIFEHGPIEENKLIYMEAFNDYNKSIETYINDNLKQIMPNFSMDEFISELHNRSDELDGEVFDMLSSFTDFLAFKELVLDYRSVQEGKVQDLSTGISVRSLKNPNFEKE